MKKIVALVMALMMLIFSCSALAETVTIEFKADEENILNVLPSMTGAPAEQLSPIIGLINKLSIKAIVAGNGFQLDLGVGEQTALSLAGAAEGEDLLIGSTVIPSYLIKLSAEDLQKLLGQMFPGGFDPEAFQKIAERLTGYIQKAAMPLMGAITPGEPESGTFEFEGCTFDTKTPYNVDTAAIAGAVKTLVSDIANDAEIMGMISSFGGRVNPQELIANVETAMSEEHMPDVTVDVYTVSGAAAPFYATSEATYKGAESASYVFWMLGKEDNTYEMDLAIVDQKTNIHLTAAQTGGLLEIIGAEEGQYAALGLGLDMENGMPVAAAIDLYFATTQNPLLSILISMAQGGELTVSLDEEGKTVLNAMELISGSIDESVMQGLQQEATTQAFQLMAIPEIATLMGTFSTSIGR